MNARNILLPWVRNRALNWPWAGNIGLIRNRNSCTLPTLLLVESAAHWRLSSSVLWNLFFLYIIMSRMVHSQTKWSSKLIPRQWCNGLVMHDLWTESYQVVSRHRQHQGKKEERYTHPFPTSSCCYVGDSTWERIWKYGKNERRKQQSRFTYVML